MNAIIGIILSKKKKKKKFRTLAVFESVISHIVSLLLCRCCECSLYAIVSQSLKKS